MMTFTDSLDEAAHRATMQIEAMQAMSGLEKVAFRQLLISFEAYKLTAYAEKAYVAQYEALIANLISYYRMRGERDKGHLESTRPTPLPKSLIE